MPSEYANRLTIMKGLPGSGKTTWAKEQIEQNGFRTKRISKDDLRAMLHNGHYSPESERFILEARNELIVLSLVQDFDIIVDDTNLNPEHIAGICNLADKETYVEIKDFTRSVSLEECIERDRKRTDKAPIGEQAIRDMYNRYIADKGSE